MLDEVTAALAAIEAEGAFATELACSSDDLHLEVEGVGPIRFQISAVTARKLCAVKSARPALVHVNRHLAKLVDELRAAERELTLDS
jgi:hypothetical protein